MRLQLSHGSSSPTLAAHLAAPHMRLDEVTVASKTVQGTARDSMSVLVCVCVFHEFAVCS